MALPSIFLRGLAADQAALLEIAQKPAEISCIEVEGARDVAGGKSVVLREFIQHPHFTERVGAVEVSLAQDTNLPRIKSIEPTDGRDACSICHGHGRSAS